MSARRALVASACAVAAILVPAQPATASDGLTLTLTSNVTKAKVGTIVEYTAALENHGTETVPALTISISLPDSLQGRAMSCPTGGQGQFFCPLGDFAPESVTEVRFYVEAADRNPTNGPVTVTASSNFVVILTAQLPQLKIVGKP
jgi:uncharacterized repeat protein (TIGR01451 family)